MTYIPLNISISADTFEKINQNLTRINTRKRGFDYKVELSPDQIAREAILYFEWAVGQSNDGKAVVSTDLSMTDISMISTPNFPADRPVK